MLGGAISQQGGPPLLFGGFSTREYMCSQIFFQNFFRQKSLPKYLSESLSNLRGASKMEKEETQKEFQPPSMIVENLSCEISAYHSEEDSSSERPLF